MAHITTDHAALVAPVNPIRRFLGRVGELLVSLSTSHGRMRQVEALQAMSDEELKLRGLSRKDIVSHVFRDVFWM
ncbi:MAG: DUF1127 domain-containing protein [Jhaorihella sp.]